MSLSRYGKLSARDLVTETITWGVNAEDASGVWTDMRFPFVRSRQGANELPHYDTTNLGLLFPQNDPTEIVQIIAQMDHDYKLESSIHPHVHFIQSAATVPVFKLAYRWYENGSAVPGEFTTITTTGLVFPYTSGSILQIAVFPYIDGSGITTVSSMLDMKFWRDDNVVTGDVLVKEFDIHYQRDTPGSYTEFAKYPS